MIKPQPVDYSEETAQLTFQTRVAHTNCFVEKFTGELFEAQKNGRNLP